MAKKLWVFLTGASGAGKTHLARALHQKTHPEEYHIAYFDQIGVPSVEEMIQQWGSGEKWQEAATHQWIEKLSAIQTPIVILEGQFNPQFAVDACKKYNQEHYLLFVVHAQRPIREKRLLEQRLQPELVNDTMNNWAEFLKTHTLQLGGTLIDTTHTHTDDIVTGVLEAIKQKDLR